MNESLAEKIERKLSEVNLETLSTDEKDRLKEEMFPLIEEVEKEDGPYILSLKNPVLYLKISYLLLDSHPKKADEFAKKSLKLEKSYGGYFISGKALFDLGDFKGALGNFDEALKYKKTAEVYRLKALALKKRGKTDRALRTIEKALEVEESKEIFALYADTLVNSGDIEKAKEYYSKIETFEKNTYLYDKKVKDLLDDAKKQSLPQNFDDVLKLDEKCVDAWIGKAERYWNIGEKEEALSVLEESENHLEDERIKDKKSEYKRDFVEEELCKNCSGTGNCIKCSGSGDCQNCDGSGDCIKCSGSGYCFNCEGSANCPNCDGKGKTGWITKCEICGGNGVCMECEGELLCDKCKGLGNCIICKGNGNCEGCQGSGGCPDCKGRGVVKTVERY